jgi:hypothetical protein
MKRSFILAHDIARTRACQAVQDAPVGYLVQISEPTKKRAQEERYHAMIFDIAQQSEYAGRRWEGDDMKRILIDEFADEMRNSGTPLHHDGRLIPSENGRRVIQLGIQSRDFYVREASAFIEFLFAWGSERGVVWTDEARQPEAVR